MAPLSNPRHEAFCLEYLKGVSAGQAYVNAGFRALGSSAGVNACRLLKNAKVRDRLHELQGEVAGHVKISTAQVLEELAKLAFVDPRKCFRDDGTVKSPIELDSDTAAALVAFEMEERHDGRRVNRIKFADKHAALVTLSKHLGLFDRKAHSGKPEDLQPSHQFVFYIPCNGRETNSKASSRERSHFE